MSEMRVLYEERTDHASGNDGSRPDAQRAAGRAAGGGGHGASSGVMHESTEVREHNLKFASLLMTLANGTFQAAAPPPWLRGELCSRPWPVHTSRLFLFS